MARDESTSPGLLASWIGLGRRRWVAGLIAFVAVAAAVAVVLLTAKPVYRADARLRLGEPPPAGGVSPTAGFIGLLRLGGDPFANDLELLGSRTVAEHVVEDVALHARLDAPRGWHRDSLFTRFGADRTTIKATYEAEWAGDAIRIHMRSPRDSLVGETKAGHPIAFGGVIAEFKPRRPDSPERFGIVTLPFDDAARTIAKRIRIERTRREANVLSLMFDDIDPAVTRGAIEAAVRRFLGLRAAILARESNETVDSLRAVSTTTMLELAQAEAALEEWQRESRLVAPDVQSEAFVERYMLVVGELEAARIEFAAMDSIFERLQRETEPSRTWVLLLSHPRFIENEPMGLLLSRMASLEDQRLALAARRAETSREATVLRNQIESLDASLRRLATSYRNALDERIGDLESQVGRMDAEFLKVPGNTVELGRRQRDVRVLSELVVLTEQRLRQEELRQALTVSNVQVIDPPQLRRRQVWPRPKLGAAVGFVLASMFGLLAMVAAETADPTVRRAGRLRALIDAPVIGSPVRTRRGVRVTERDAAAIAAVATRAKADAIVLAAVTGDASDLAGALVAEANGAGITLPALRVAPAMSAFGDAVLAGDVPVVLVVEAAKTPRHKAAAAAARVREAGGTVLGALLVCRSERAAREAWG